MMSPPPMPGKVSSELLRAPHGIKSVRRFARDATLFREGELATGVYVVESGDFRVLFGTVRVRSNCLKSWVPEPCSG